MKPSGQTTCISRRDLTAVLFDLDGVVTKTATVHAAAWKRLFDEFLRRRAQRTGSAFQPFDAQRDYREYVDGKPRYDGVRSFLRSRHIVLEDGEPSDPPDRETVCGLGNRKDGYFERDLADRGVETYDGTISLIQRLKQHGFKTAVVSASKHCAAILETAGIANLFDARVDGNDAERLGLAGKPAPATYLEAARRLDVVPARAVVVEDAIAGVQAGRAGGFGLVIGVNRSPAEGTLLESGADIVVRDLNEMTVTS